MAGDTGITPPTIIGTVDEKRNSPILSGVRLPSALQANEHWKPNSSSMRALNELTVNQSMSHSISREKRNENFGVTVQPGPILKLASMPSIWGISMVKAVPAFVTGTSCPSNIIRSMCSVISWLDTFR